MFLGEFEQLVLIASIHLGDAAYAMSIVNEIDRRTGRQPGQAAVYVTLRRLERKGLLESWKGEPTAERGGKARRHVKITRAGALALLQSRRTFEQMWRGLDAHARRVR